MDIFESKNIKPMLIGEVQDAFDDPDYIYELKLDGVRCLAYLDENGVDLRNKRNMKVSPLYPELMSIHKQVKKRCILDGELIVVKNGKPDFPEMQRRSLMTNKFRIELAASKLPVSFTAYDILYLDNKSLTDLPLIERKALLKKAVKENERLSISRYVEEKGVDFYTITVQLDLEGIVAKYKYSKYHLGKLSKDWIKIKYLKDDDYVVCGYIEKNKAISVILAQYQGNQLVYKGHVAMGVSKEDFITITTAKKVIYPPFPVPKGHEHAIWINPTLVCTVKYMTKTEKGGLRQPVFKGLRTDKAPYECVVSDNDLVYDDIKFPNTPDYEHDYYS